MGNHSGFFNLILTHQVCLFLIRTVRIFIKYLSKMSKVRLQPRPAQMEKSPGFFPAVSYQTIGAPSVQNSVR